MALSSVNVRRLFLSVVMLAAKFHDDAYYTNAYYAEVGGLTLKEMNMLEARLIKLLNWNVNVTSEEYREYLRIVCEAAGLQGGIARLLLQTNEPEPEP
jgi:hypothetical protein